MSLLVNFGKIFKNTFFIEQLDPALPCSKCAVVTLF